MSRTALIAAAALVIAGAGAGAWFALSGGDRFAQCREGGAVVGASIGGPFTLTRGDGARVSDADVIDRPTLVYFGYTHCPDVCPAALGVIASAMQQMEASQAGRVGGIFISVDPQRDTPALLNKYVSFFDKRIRGLTGTREQLDQVAAQWRVDYEVPEHPADANYEVEHTNFIYLVNRDGKVVDLFDEQTDPALIADRMRPWL